MIRSTFHVISSFFILFHVPRLCWASLAQSFQCPDTVVNPLVVKGKNFFDSVTGEYFPIKGIAYYPRPNDGRLSISNSVDFFTRQFEDLWMADIENFKRLGVNTIRIYAVDPSQDHSSFMCELQKAGIYVIVGLLADCEGCNIGPDEAPSCYPASLKERGQFIMNEFSRYSNTLAFSAGNEVTLYARDRQIELNAPCQKKFLLDMRSYLDTCSAVQNTVLPRKIPIGMVNWDNERELQTRYFNCQTSSNALETPEWYGINVYLHCDTTATVVDDLVAWQGLRDDFSSFGLPVPAVVAEFGCRERGFPTIGDFEAQRTWLQIEALYSESYQDVFAGGVVFEYSAEKRIVDQSDQGHPWPYFQFMKLNYGVGYYSPVDCDHESVPCSYTPYPEFTLLAEAFRQVDVSFVPGIDDYAPGSLTAPTCPTGLAGIDEFTWSVDDSPGLPCYAIVTDAPTAAPTVPPPTQTPPGQSSNGDSSTSLNGNEEATSSGNVGAMWRFNSLLAIASSCIYLLI